MEMLEPGSFFSPRSHEGHEEENGFPHRESAEVEFFVLHH
jgi:hypothetical protein